MRWRLCTIAVLLVSCLAADVRADVEIGVTVGWQGPYRPGRWTPVYVTTIDKTPRDVILEFYAPSDQNYAMKVAQVFPVSPTPQTRALYMPLSYALHESSITLRDAKTLRFAGSVKLEDFAPVAVQPNHMLIGISGNESTSRLLEGQIRQGNIKTGILPQSYLPRVPVGYDALDLLVLNQPNFSRLEADQQGAIIQWVRGGGMLLLIPGLEPLPEKAPLLEVLPVKLGENRTYDLSTQALSEAGLAERFKTLKGRTVSAVAEGAVTNRLFNDRSIVGYRQWLGYGQVMVIPADISMLMFETAEQARTFWTRALDRVVNLPPEEDQSNTNYYMSEDPRRQAAALQAMDWAGDVPGAGQFGFSYLAMALLAMMLVVGPVDWFVLKWLGRQPWTWVTTAGWIGVVTLAALYVGHIFKSGELYFRSVTVNDESEGMRIAQMSLAGIYSPRTREYELELAPESWWRPATNNAYTRGGGGLHREIDFHQDYRGNRPENLLINVWNLRFLQGEDATPTGAVVSAKLSRSGDELSGSVANQGQFALSDVIIRTKDGPLRLAGTIAPGATMNVSGKIDRRDKSLASTLPSERRQYHGYGNELPSTRPTLPHGGDIAVMRTDRIERILRERPDFACVYAQFEDVRPQAAKLDEPEARQSHVGMIRALVAMETK